MIKRYLLTAFSILGLVLLYLFSLLPLLVARSGLAGGQFLLAVLIWGLLVLATLLPILSALFRKIWFFPGQGEAVVPELLQSMLLGINDFDAPVRARLKGKKMVFSWRVDEPGWCEPMHLAGIRRLYELWLVFDHATRTVVMTDRVRKVRFIHCPNKVKRGLLTNPRPVFRVGYGPDWGIENYEDARAADFTFHAREIKSPVMSTILKNGWNVRFNLL